MLHPDFTAVAHKTYLCTHRGHKRLSVESWHFCYSKFSSCRGKTVNVPWSTNIISTFSVLEITSCDIGCHICRDQFIFIAQVIDKGIGIHTALIIKTNVCRVICPILIFKNITSAGSHKTKIVVYACCIKLYTSVCGCLIDQFFPCFWDFRYKICVVKQCSSLYGKWCCISFSIYITCLDGCIGKS